MQHALQDEGDYQQNQHEHIPDSFLLFISYDDPVYLEAALGKKAGISGDEPVIFLHPSEVSVFLSILPACRYTFGKPVPGLVNFRVCRNYEHAATSCYGEEARAVCEEFSGQVSQDYSGE